MFGARAYKDVVVKTKGQASGEIDVEEVKSDCPFMLEYFQVINASFNQILQLEQHVETTSRFFIDYKERCYDLNTFELQHNHPMDEILISDYKLK